MIRVCSKQIASRNDFPQNNSQFQYRCVIFKVCSQDMDKCAPIISFCHFDVFFYIFLVIEIAQIIISVDMGKALFYGKFIPRNYDTEGVILAGFLGVDADGGSLLEDTIRCFFSSAVGAATWAHVFGIPGIGPRIHGPAAFLPVLPQGSNKL